MSTQKTWESGWEIVRELGKGGQGTVHLVRRRIPNNLVEQTRLSLKEVVAGTSKDVLLGTPEQERINREFLTVCKAINQVGELQCTFRALKELHSPEQARDPERMMERFRREVEAFQSINHPNLLKIHESSIDQGWYLAEFYEKGNLSVHPEMFHGDVVGSLKAIRPLVEAVGQLHDRNMVHRDIKPENVFIASDNRLVLGDCGLVFFDDEARISSTHSNVGSRDWMPAWAMTVRADEVTPKFDVFSLGKLLWSMISGDLVCPLWYFNKPQYDITKKFPQAESINLVNGLLGKCIVEEERRCRFKDANARSQEIDELFWKANVGVEILSDDLPRRCRVCGIGTYVPIVDADSEKASRFGLSPTEDRKFQIYSCGACGHVQWFTYTGGPSPMAGWKRWTVAGKVHSH